MKPCENCGHVERIYFTCPACGVSFEVASETSTRIFCSTTCRRLTYETPVSTDRKLARELLAEAVGA